MLASGTFKGSSLTGETPSYSAPAAFGRFQVLHQIGAGVLGPVFLARDPDRARSIAVKVFRLDITPEQAAELAVQLTGLARANLAHPSIVVPFEAGVEGTIAFLAEDYVSGESLDAAIRQYGPPPATQALRILAAVAGALDFASAVGIHHGALHPRDLLVTAEETRVTGFGVGRALEAIGLRAPMRRPYVAPERVQREGWDSRADVYSLGVLARELLAGRARSDSPDLRLPDEQAERLHPVLMRAVSARPADRFSSSLELVAAVQDALAGGAHGAAAGPAARAARLRQRTHDLLLPLGGEGAEPPEPPASPEAERLRLEDHEAPGGVAGTDDLAATVPALTPLPDLDLHPGVSDERPSAEAIDLSHVDGRADARVEEASTFGQGAGLAGLGHAAAPDVEGRAFDIDSIARPDGTVSRSVSEIEGPVPGEVEAGVPVQPASETERADRQRVEAEQQAVISGPQAGTEDTDLQLPVQAAAAVSDRAIAGPSPHGESGDRTVVVQQAAGRFRSLGPLVLAVLVVGILIGALGGYMFGARGRGERPAEQSRALAPVAPLPATPVASQPATGTPAGGGTPGGAVGGAPGPARGAAESRANPPQAIANPPTAGSHEATPVKGVLLVRSTPRGATVTINGRKRGVTPLRVRDMAAGQYTVRLSRPGYKTEQRDVAVSADRPSATLTFSLDRAAPSLSPDRASRTERASRDDFFGSLAVESQPPGARVFLDGRLLGTTPLADTRIAAGSHVVRLDRIGFLPWTSPIQIVTGQRLRVTASLERETR